MTEKFKIFAKYIKDMSSETPDIETFLFVKDNISKYQLNIDIKPGTNYKKPPKLMELHQELFETVPNNLHNSMIDVFVTFRCLHQMIYERDIFDGVKHVELTNYYMNMCGL